MSRDPTCGSFERPPNQLDLPLATGNYSSRMPEILSVERDAPPVPRPPSWLRRYRYDLLWGSIVVALVAAAFEVPHLHLAWLSPVTHQTAGQYKVLAQTAPILGKWLPHANWATVGQSWWP